MENSWLFHIITLLMQDMCFIQSASSTVMIIHRLGETLYMGMYNFSCKLLIEHTTFL